MANQLNFFEATSKQKEPPKPYVRLKTDCKELNKEFINGSVFPLFAEKSEGPELRIDDTYYIINPKYCEVIK